MCILHAHLPVQHTHRSDCRSTDTLQQPGLRKSIEAAPAICRCSVIDGHAYTLYNVPTLYRLSFFFQDSLGKHSLLQWHLALNTLIEDKHRCSVCKLQLRQPTDYQVAGIAYAQAEQNSCSENFTLESFLIGMQRGCL